MIKAVLFDCFGVVYTDKFDELFVLFGGDLEESYEFIQDMFFRASKGELEDVMPELTAHLGITEEQWRSEQEKQKGFNDELLEYTKELRKDYKVGMLSNIGVEGLAHHMDYRVLEEHFDVVVESAKIGFAKPEARAYEIAAEQLGVRLDEVVFTDDREVYVEGAEHVGMQAILFKGTEQFKRELESLVH